MFLNIKPERQELNNPRSRDVLPILSFKTSLGSTATNLEVGIEYIADQISNTRLHLIANTIQDAGDYIL